MLGQRPLLVMTARPKHIPELDGLRAVAVLMVMMCHSRVVPGGITGVDVFFVLSGWLITGILLREAQTTGRIGWRAFMSRRVLRLVPASAVMLTIMVAIDPLLWRDALIAFFALMKNRLILDPSGNPFAPTWSLAQEWQFYLVWPLFVTWGASRPKALVAGLLTGAWAVLTLIRSALIFSGEYTWSYNSPLHWSGLLLGAAIATWPPGTRVAHWVGWAGLIAIVATLAIPPMASTAWTIPLTEVAAAAVVLRPPRALAWRPAVGLGTISYGVYLWHAPGIILFNAFQVPYGGVLGCAAAILIAAMSYRLVERPFLRARRPAPAAADASASA